MIDETEAWAQGERVTPCDVCDPYPHVQDAHDKAPTMPDTIILHRNCS